MAIQINGKKVVHLGSMTIPIIKGDIGPEGKQGKRGVPGNDGKDGQTPLRGIDYWNQADKDAIKQEIYAEIDPKLDNKVDKEQGKGLSTNDFTNILKEKLDNLENYNDAEIRNLLNGSLKNVNYTASNGMLTFTKNDGSTLSVDLPLELLIESGRYDEANKQIVLVLANGNSINIPVSSLLDDFYGKGETYNKTEVDTIIAEKQALIDKLEEENQKQQEELDILNSEYTEKELEGETVVISNGLPKSKIAVKGNGNTKQETTEGYNLLNIEKYFYNENDSRLNNGTITIENGNLKMNGTNATATMTAKSKFFGKTSEEIDVLPAGTYYFGVNTNGYYEDDLETLVQFTIGVKTLTKNYRLVQWYFPCGVGEIVERPLLISKDTSKTTYEPYTNGVATPNTNHKQDIEVIEAYNEFDKNNANVLEAYFNSGATLKITPFSSTKMIYIECKENTEYTISKMASARFYVGYTTELPALGVAVYNPLGTDTKQETKYTIKTGDNAKYLVVFLYHSGYDTTITFEEIIDTLLIHKGTDYLPYLPYGHIGLVQKGIQLLDFSNIKTGSSSGITVTSNKDGSYNINGTVTNVAINVWLFGGYASSGLTTLLTLKAGSSYYVRDAYLFAGQTGIEGTQPKGGHIIKPSSYINVTGVRVPQLVNGTTHNETLYPIIAELPEGVTELNWEPYKEPIVHSIDLDGNSLAKDDNVEISVSGSVKANKNIFIEKIDSTKAIEKSQYGTNTYKFELSKKPFDNYAEINVISNYFKGVKYANRTNEYLDGIYIEFGSTENLAIIRNTPFTTLEELKTFLDSNDVYIKYQLAETEVINLPSIEPIELFEGTNIFELVTNLGTTLAVTYKVSNKKKILNLEERIAALESAVIGG